MHLKKLMAVALSIALIITSMPTRDAEASWFSDLMGGIFTVITSPILLVAPNNPTLRKNNPFRKKVWEEDAEKEKEREIILRLSSQQQPQQQAAPTTETIVVEKTVEVVHEVVKDNSAEINELKKEIDEMKKDVAGKATEIATLQHLVDDAKGFGYQSFPFANFGRGFDFVTEGNVTKIVVDMPETQVVLPQPTMTNERDRRKFWGFVARAAMSFLIAKLFYVNPKIDVVRVDLVYRDVTPRLNVFLKTSALVVSQYFVYKFVNKRLTPSEIWTDAKGVSSDAAYAVVDVVNGTYHGAKNYIAYPVGNATVRAAKKTSNTAKKFYEWEYFWTAISVVAASVVALTGVFFYARCMRARARAKAAKLSSGSSGLAASMGIQNIGSFAPESVTQSGNLKTSPPASASASSHSSGKATPPASSQTSTKVSSSSSPHSSGKMSPQGSPQTSTKVSANATPPASGKSSPQGSPQGTPQGSATASSSSSPPSSSSASPQGSPQGSATASGKSSAQISPSSSGTIATATATPAQAPAAAAPATAGLPLLNANAQPA